MRARPDILCIGAMLWDVIGRAHNPIGERQDVPGRISHVPGGVALNVALALARLGARPAILSTVGPEPEGDALVAEAARRGIDVAYLTRSKDLPTDVYMAIEDASGLVAAIADAHSLEQAGERILAPLSDALADWKEAAVIDGNLTVALLEHIAKDPRLQNADLRIVPASPGKADRLAPLIAAGRGTFYLNRFEAEILAGRTFEHAAPAAEAVVALGAPRVIVTDGAEAAADAAQDHETVTAAPPPVEIRRVTGAGDCFLAAHITAERAGVTPLEALTRAGDLAARHVAGEQI